MPLLAGRASGGRLAPLVPWLALVAPGSARRQPPGLADHMDRRARPPRRADLDTFTLQASEMLRLCSWTFR